MTRRRGVIEFITPRYYETLQNLFSFGKAIFFGEGVEHFSSGVVERIFTDFVAVAYSDGHIVYKWKIKNRKFIWRDEMNFFDFYFYLTQ